METGCNQLVRYVGPLGEKGYKGPPGGIGGIGPNGQRGIMGYTGPKGPTGYTGPSKGDTGGKGATGNAGINGVRAFVYGKVFTSDYNRNLPEADINSAPGGAEMFQISASTSATLILTVANLSFSTAKSEATLAWRDDDTNTIVSDTIKRINNRDATSFTKPAKKCVLMSFIPSSLNINGYTLVMVKSTDVPDSGAHILLINLQGSLLSTY